MHHSDAALVPESITTKAEFWSHVYSQVESLLDGQRNWVSNLANASSVMYNSLLAFPAYFGRDDDKAVNWCGFYIHSDFFPRPKNAEVAENERERLLLGPFGGKPACQFINVKPGKGRGVCADGFLKRQTLVIADVNSYPGHIACDGKTQSEFVCPLILHDGENEERVLGVLDLDCLAPGAFDEDDRVGLERIADLVVKGCDW